MIGRYQTNCSDTFKQERRRAIKAAKELFYGDEVIQKLNAAKTVGELNYILKVARSGAR